MRPGYTLTEILAVSLILALAAAVVIPTYLADPVLEDTERFSLELQRVLHKARRLATETAKPITVTITGSTTAELKTWRFEDTRLVLLRTDLVSAGGARLEQAPLAFRLAPDGGVSGDSIVIRSGAATRVLRIGLSGDVEQVNGE